MSIRLILIHGAREPRVPAPFGLAQREMIEEPQGQGGLDGEIRGAPPPAAVAVTSPLERGPDGRSASSPRGTSSSTGAEPSTASLQGDSCGDEKGGPNRPTRRRSLLSSPGGLLPRGPHQNRTRRFPPSGSSADVAHGDAPQIRTRIRGTGRGYRSNNATNLGQGSTTFRISGDMSPDVNAPVMGPFESSHQHGPPLLGRVRGPTRSPMSSLVCSPPTPSRPSAAALRGLPGRRGIAGRRRECRVRRGELAGWPSVVRLTQQLRRNGPDAPGEGAESEWPSGQTP